MFKGIQKNSFVDYPGKIATTLFTGGCNFRCPWCHNLNLVLPEKLTTIPDLPETEIKNIILERKHFIDGVCITGGEPTLWGEELASFMRWVKNENLLVKLDTNGYKPDILEKYYKERLIDYTAMDIKCVQERYHKVVGLPSIKYELIEKSINLIRTMSPEYQFRTTLAPNLVTLDDVQNINKKYGLDVKVQEYRDINNTW